jgi:hypothetical protein
MYGEDDDESALDDEEEEDDDEYGDYNGAKKRPKTDAPGPGAAAGGRCTHTHLYESQG